MKKTQETSSVLVIDDDPLARTLAAESLKASGFEVDQAVDGPSGLALIKQRRPDLVLLDVMMPGIDGYEVCLALRERPELARIPVIMLTGLDDTPSIERAYESGATDFITKPINAALLTYRVRYALRASRMVDEIERQHRSLANAQRIACLGGWTWQPSSARFECSAEYQRVTGGHSMEPDFHWRDTLHHVHPEDAMRVAQAMDSAIEAGEAYAMSYRVRCRDGAYRTLYEQTDVIRNEDGSINRIEGTTQDITERVLAQERIRQLADYDGLTGLANRKMFGEALQHGLNHCARKLTRAAVLHVNIDRFKRVNETLGYAPGDRVLKEIAHRVVETVRASGLAPATNEAARSGLSARMSGDGFAVHLTEVRRAEDAALIAQRLIDAVARPIQCGDHELNLTASVGIAVYPENGADAGSLLANAEIALHRAKDAGPGSYSYFNSAMNARSLAKLELESDLRRAIERDELVLFFQPRIDVPTGRLAGAEALVRWQHPQRGLVPPNDFIPVAEESGLIAPLTAWVVRAACRQLQQWRRAGLAEVPLSVNLSAHSFREAGLTELISASLRECDIEPSLLEGEITESMLMQDVESAVTRLHELRAIGIKLAMDDFGTGYSSLAYLKRFPLNVLKIDRAFVKDVLTDSQDAAVAASIVTLGKTMGLDVVAEGMECVEQANYLLSLGCRHMQGFLFSRPMPAGAFAELLRDGLPMPGGLCLDAALSEAQAERYAQDIAQLWARTRAADAASPGGTAPRSERTNGLIRAA